MNGYFYKEKDGSYTVMDWDNPKPVQSWSVTLTVYIVIVLIISLLNLIGYLIG